MKDVITYFAALIIWAGIWAAIYSAPNTKAEETAQDAPQQAQVIEPTQTPAPTITPEIRPYKVTPEPIDNSCAESKKEAAKYGWYVKSCNPLEVYTIEQAKINGWL